MIVSKGGTSSQRIDAFENYPLIYKYTLWQLTQASYRNGNSNALNDYLYRRIDERNQPTELDPSVEDELHQLLLQITLENYFAQDYRPNANRFKIAPNNLGSTEYAVYYAPLKDEETDTIACFSQHQIQPALSIPDIDTCLEIPYFLCGRFFGKVAFTTLPEPNPRLDPDLTLDFLKIIENPDRRVF